MPSELFGDDLCFKGDGIAYNQLQFFQRGAVAGPDFLEGKIVPLHGHSLINDYLVVVIGEMIGHGRELFDGGCHLELLIWQDNCRFLFGFGRLLRSFRRFTGCNCLSCTGSCCRCHSRC
ncbi:hypothetical protein D3C75_955980 [compost metagenome]